MEIEGLKIRILKQLTWKVNGYCTECKWENGRGVGLERSQDTSGV